MKAWQFNVSIACWLLVLAIAYSISERGDRADRALAESNHARAEANALIASESAVLNSSDADNARG